MRATSSRACGILIACIILLGSAASAGQSNLIANGSFEHWGMCSDIHLSANKFLGDKPVLVPVRWRTAYNAPVRSETAHGGKYSACLSKSAHLSMDVIELNPGSTYTFGVWAKGDGSVKVNISGYALEGPQLIKSTEAQLSSEWKLISDQFTMPSHLRLTSLSLEVGVKNGAQVFVDDAQVSCDLGFDYDADAVLNAKPQKDANTIFIESFDDAKGVTFPGKSSKSQIVDNGRFGKGLRIAMSDYVMLNFKADKMPSEGTLEFWLSHDDMTSGDLVGMHSGTTSIVGIGGGHSTWWGWPLLAQGPHKYGSIADRGNGGQLARPGSWTHHAVSWDQYAVRGYVNGVQTDVSYDPPAWKDAPTSIMIGPKLAFRGWSGIVDEIRLSSVCRIAPFVPKGDKMVAPPKPVPAVVEAPPEKHVQMDEKLIAKERSKLITPLLSPDVKYENESNEKGEYLYNASALKPLVSSDRLDIQKDKIRPGFAVAVVQGQRDTHCYQPDVHGAYWKLGAIKPGRYYVGVLSQGSPPPIILLNGRIAQATRRTDEVQAAPGFFAAETQVDQPLDLKPGDEIAIQVWGSLTAVQLALRTEAPERGRHPVAGQYGGGRPAIYTSHALSTEVTWKDTKGQQLPYADHYWRSDQLTTLPETIQTGPDGKPVVHVRVYNPLPVALKVNLDTTIRSYYRNVVGTHKEQLVIQPHETIDRLVSFTPIDDEPSYSALAKVEAVDKPELGWPQGDTVNFFAGLRHTIPWLDPFKHEMLRRVEFTRPIKSVRQVINLIGEWEKAYTTEYRQTWPMPADLKFERGGVPMSWFFNDARMRQAKPRNNSVYLRRKFTLPPEAAGRTYNVFIQYAIDAAAVWVNGQHVGTVLGGNTPLVADATKAIKVGENEIVIQVMNLLVLMNPDFVNPASPEPSQIYLDVPGFFSGTGCGLEGVEIRTSPIVAAQQIQAIPSFRNKDLTVRFSVVNNNTKANKVRVKTHVLDEGKSVLQIDERELTLEPSKPVNVVTKKAWANPRLWGPKDPHLYTLAVEIFDAASGERLDLARERFGFRESWIDGPHIIFNGVALRPKGCGEPRYETDGLIFTRGTQGGTDYCDEIGRTGGHFVTQLTNSSSRHNLERDKYWESCKVNAIKHIDTMINHPSIIAWDFSNEWLQYLDYYTPDPMLGAKRFKNVSDHIRAYDPSRWTLANAEGDLQGLLDNHSFHYMKPWFFAERITGHQHYYPDAEFWRPLDRHFKPNEEVPLSPHESHTILRPDKKVIMDTELLWKVNETMPPHMSQYCDELDVLGNAANTSSGECVWFWKTQIDGHRDLGVAPIHHYALMGIHSRACPTRTFIMPDTAHNGFSGQKMTKLVTVINDEATEANANLRWELLLSDQAVMHGEESLRMATGSKHPTQIELTLPNVSKRTRFVLRAQMYVDNKFVIGQELDIDVWPNKPISPGALARKVFLIDPSGKTAEVLKDAGVKFETLPTLSAPAGEADKALLVIGEKALDEASALACSKLIDFVQAGGRVLVLEQTVTLSGLPADTKLDKSRWVSISFPRMANHPIVQGITSWDLSFWSSDRVVSRGSYFKPSSGMALSIIDSGGYGGLEHVHLMEQYRGKGMQMLCQLALVSNYNREPMTRELLARIFNYMGNSEPFLKPARKLQTVVAAEGDISKRLDDVTAQYEQTGLSKLSIDKPALVEASLARAASPADIAALQKFLQDGGAAAVACATPEDASWLSKITGAEVKFTVLPYPNWLGRGMRSGYSPFTAGLSHLDLYFKQYDGAESGGSQSEDIRLVIEPLQDWAVQAAGGKELLWPGLLMEMKVGKGTLLIDQRRWMTSAGELVKLASRNVTSLMLGLGVEMAAAVPLRQLPKEVAYQTIDIRQFTNRSLMDEKSGDGVGGWSDQGAGADLRSFKTGKLSFQGIPFLVGDHPNSCIVLAAHHQAGHEDMLREATIPVEKAVEGFYFLHGFAWGGTKLATYEVQYADGTKYDIELTTVNTRDWVAAPSNSFAREKFTTSTVAWTGGCQMFSMVAVYKMLWVNPKPEVPVKAIRFHKDVKNGGVPILMGITSITPRQIKTLTAQEQAKVADLVKQARDAEAGKDIDGAQKLLRQALAINPQAWEVYQKLADLLEQKGDDDVRMEHYQSWVHNGSIVPLPFNRIAEILEKRKDLRGALEFYTRSLQVEWNQPPVIENKKRLESAVRK